MVVRTGSAVQDDTGRSPDELPAVDRLHYRHISKRPPAAMYKLARESNNRLQLPAIAVLSLTTWRREPSIAAAAAAAAAAAVESTSAASRRRGI